MRRALAALLGALLAGAALAQSNEPLTCTVRKFTGELAARVGQGEWADVQPGQNLVATMELCTGPASEATLAFSDGSVLVLKELSQLRVGELLSQRNRIRIELYLRLGELKAQVKPQQALSTDFSVRTPNATASVKGTEIQRISYHPPEGTRTELVSGSLLVQTERGQTLIGGGDESLVRTEGELVTPAALSQEDSRIHVEPGGLTSGEKEQISVTNQPQGTSTSTQSETTQSNPGTGDASLLLRFQVQ